VRYSLLSIEAPVIPFFGLHFGPGVSFDSDGLDGLYANSTMFGFELSGGVDIPVSKNYGIGSEFSYSYFTPTDGFDSTVYHFVDLTLEIRLGF
jgi:opacity protein-like surface antigen